MNAPVSNLLELTVSFRRTFIFLSIVLPIRRIGLKPLLLTELLIVFVFAIALQRQSKAQSKEELLIVFVFAIAFDFFPVPCFFAHRLTAPL